MKIELTEQMIATILEALSAAKDDTFLRSSKARYLLAERRIIKELNKDKNNE